MLHRARDSGFTEDATEDATEDVTEDATEDAIIASPFVRQSRECRDCWPRLRDRQDRRLVFF